MSGENLRGSFTDVANPDTKKQAPELQGPACLDFPNQIFGGFRSHALQLFKLGLGQMIQIRDVMDEVPGDKLIDQPLTQPVDFHRSAAGPMKQGFLQLCRTRLR